MLLNAKIHNSTIKKHDLCCTRAPSRIPDALAKNHWGHFLKAPSPEILNGGIPDVGSGTKVLGASKLKAHCLFIRCSLAKDRADSFEVFAPARLWSLRANGIRIKAKAGYPITISPIRKCRRGQFRSIFKTLLTPTQKQSNHQFKGCAEIPQCRILERKTLFLYYVVKDVL